METNHFEERREPEIAFSRSIKAGRRIYYLDVKKAKNNDLYVCITESKKTSHGENVAPSFEKHKVFLYKEDFSRFMEGLEEVVEFVKSEMGEIQEREEWTPSHETTAEDVVEPQEDLEEKKKGGLFGFLKK